MADVVAPQGWHPASADESSFVDPTWVRDRPATSEIKVLKLDAATQKALDQGNDITIEVEGQTYLIMQWRGKRSGG